MEGISKIKKNPFVRMIVFEDRYMLVNRRQTYELNEVGKDIWENIDGLNSQIDILEFLCREYKEINRQEVEKDIDKCIKQFVKYELVTKF